MFSFPPPISPTLFDGFNHRIFQISSKVAIPFTRQCSPNFRLSAVTKLKRSLIASLFYTRIEANALRNNSHLNPVDSHRSCSYSIFD